MLTPEHSRAARGWLDWTQGDLAKKANVSLSTVRDFEAGRRVPIANNIDAILRVFAANGIQLLVDGKRPAGIAAVAPSGSGARAGESGTPRDGGGRA